MSVTDRFVTARLIEERCELHYECGGLWNIDTIEELFATLNRTCLPLVQAGKPIYSIADFSAAIPQERATAEKIAGYLKEAQRHGLKRTAIFGAPALMKMQYKRISQGITLEFFDTEREALAWLRADRTQS